jgi:hypothetical protein
MAAARCAERLAAGTGLPVAYEDIETLADLGLLVPVDYYKQRPLYDLDTVDALAGRDTLTELVAARRAWFEASLTAREAAYRLRWSDELAQQAGA